MGRSLATALLKFIGDIEMDVRRMSQEEFDEFTEICFQTIAEKASVTHGRLLAIRSGLEPDESPSVEQALNYYEGELIACAQFIERQRAQYR